MGDFNLLSKDHFAAHQQVIADYRLLLICETELTKYSDRKTSQTYFRLKNQIIVLLERIIGNKNILKMKTKADQEYLQSLRNSV